MKLGLSLSIVAMIVFTSIALTFLVSAEDLQNYAPIVKITSPISGESIQKLSLRDSAGTVIQFTVDSAYPVSRCSLSIDNQLYSYLYLTSKNGVVALDLDYGLHTVSIQCLNSKGYEGNKDTVSFYVFKSFGQLKKFK